jgi:hypothetical protein
MGRASNWEHVPPEEAATHEVKARSGNEKTRRFQRAFSVAGAGFEPATFGL